MSHELNLVLQERIAVPDTVQLVGLAITSGGGQLIAWGPDYPGYWARDLVSTADAWIYVEPPQWAGTVGVLHRDDRPTLVVVDSLGSMVESGVGSLGAMLAGESMQLDPEGPWRLVSVAGQISDHSQLEWHSGDGKIVGSKGTKLLPQEILVGPLRPFLLQQARDDGTLVLSRDPSQGIQRLVGDAFVSLGRLDRSRAVQDVIRPDSGSQWTIAGALDLGGGLMLTLADLKSDRRVLARLDDTGKMRSCRTLSSPYALIAASADGRFAVAGVWDQGTWLLIYEVHVGAPYADEDVPSCSA